MATTDKPSTAELLFRQADRMGLEPSWVIPGGIFAIRTQTGEKYINRTVSALNTHTSANLSRNKYLTRVLLQRHGLPNIPFARPRTMIEARLFLENYRKIIVKPRDGFGSQGIRIVENPAQLLGISLADSIFEQYVVGKEMRYLVLDGKVISVHESRYGTSVNPDRYLERISYGPTEWDARLADMTLQITSILGLRFGAVDFLVDATGRAYVLEVNSSPGLKWFHAPTSGPQVDVAALFMQAVVAT